MRVVEIWRYPIKSVAGERVDSVAVDARGLEGDRRWALVDAEGMIASGKRSRRFRPVSGLLRQRASIDQDATMLTLADGRSAEVGTAAADELVSAIAPGSWQLRQAESTPFVDSAPVHLVTTATLKALAGIAGGQVVAERFRPNLVIELSSSAEFPENDWVGRALSMGTLQLQITEPTERCVMVGHDQDGIEPHPGLLTTIGRVNDVCAGVYAEVITPGIVSVGDDARLG